MTNDQDSTITTTRYLYLCIDCHNVYRHRRNYRQYVATHHITLSTTALTLAQLSRA